MERFQLRLITEGKTDRTLLETLLDHKQRHIDIPRLPPKDVKDAGGYSWLTKRGNLDAFLNAGDAERFGIIVDADTNPIARWESLRNRLVEFAFDADQLPGILPADGLVATFPKRRPVGVWLMPGYVHLSVKTNRNAELAFFLYGFFQGNPSTIDFVTSVFERFRDVHRRDRSVQHAVLTTFALKFQANLSHLICL